MADNQEVYVSQSSEDHSIGQQNEGITAGSFKDFLLKGELERSLQENGFEKPSDVQNQALNHVIEGKDIICQAQAGTGKTAVFVLAILTSMDQNTQPITCVVIAPVRELVMQIKEEFKRFAKQMPYINVVSLIGGEEKQKNIRDIKNQKPQIIVGTPGRMNELVKSKELNLNNVKYFVIDECDKIMETDNMRKDVLEIFTRTPQQKQTMMFSGTISDQNRKYCEKFFIETPVLITVKDQSDLVLNGLSQYQKKVAENEKIRLLKFILKEEDYNQCIIFAKTPVRVKTLSTVLDDAQIFNLAIYGSLDQQTRTEIYGEFQKNHKKILIANQIFERGMDFSKVNLVINYDMPDSIEAYLHRVGRAGRQKTQGQAISFVTKEDEDFVNKLQQTLKTEIKSYSDIKKKQ